MWSINSESDTITKIIVVNTKTNSQCVPHKIINTNDTENCILTQTFGVFLI